MNRLGAFAYGAAIFCIALLLAREVIYPGLFLYEELPGEKFALGLPGWLVATLGPLGLSIWFWRLMPSSVLHLLFIPSAVAILQLGEWMLLFGTAAPNSELMEGRTLMAAFGFTLLALLVHAGAAVVLFVAGMRQRLMDARHR